MLDCVFDIIPVGAAAVDFECGVVAPFVGITYLHGEGVKFFKGALFGGVAHPRKSVYMFAECRLEVTYKCKHLFF